MVGDPQSADACREAAHEYLDRGLPPTLCAGKKPLGMGWKSVKRRGSAWQHHRWTHDEIDRAFRVCRYLNVGLLMGPEGGLIDAEADSAEEEQAFADLFDGNPPVAPTFESARGKHRLFRFPPALAGSGVGIAKYKGLGIRIGADGKGAHSCAPPSVNTDGTIRKWNLSIADCDPPVMPDFVVERLLAAGKKADRPSGSAPEASGDIVPAVTAMRRVKTADKGDGSKRLFAYACRAVEHNLTDALALLAIRMVAAEKPFPKEWSDAEITQRLRDAEGKTTRGKAFSPNAWLAEGRTDAANAHRFLERHGNDVRWCDPHGAFYIWSGKRWAQDRERRVELMAARVVADLWGDVKAAAKTKDVDEKLRAELVRFAKSSNGANGIRNLLTVARSSVAVLPEQFDSHHYLLNCANGTLDLKTGELREHRREDYLTKLCPTAYNPEAPSLTWDRFLDSTFDGKQDVIDFKQRFLGYCLTGDVKEQLFIVNWGGGSNGKTTLQNAYADTVGDDFVMQAPHGFLMAAKGERHPTEQWDLRGRRFVSAVETGDGRRLDEELVKRLTGSETVRARKMYADFEEFKPTHKLAIATNYKPKIRGTDHAIWRRIALVPYNVKFWNPDKGETGPEHLKQDKELPAKLAAEAEGILAWAVRGCLDWQRGGLRMPEAVAAATEGYRTDQDVIGRFVSECCLPIEGKTPFKQLYEALEAWCEDVGDTPPSRKAVAAWLDNAGYERIPNRQREYWGIGIRL